MKSRNHAGKIKSEFGGMSPEDTWCGECVWFFISTLTEVVSLRTPPLEVRMW